MENRLRWENDMEMYLREKGRGYENLIELAQNKVKIINLRQI